jgi:hypothetical protein
MMESNADCVKNARHKMWVLALFVWAMILSLVVDQIHLNIWALWGSGVLVGSTGAALLMECFGW